MFTPARVPIASITQANPCQVTTSAVHNLTTGQIVRLNVPQTYGMYQLNKVLASVVVLSPTTFACYTTQVPVAQTINSTSFSAFSIPANPGLTAEVLSVGSGPVPINTTPPAIIEGRCDSLTKDATSNYSITPIPF